jgi:hypothetical protein
MASEFSADYQAMTTGGEAVNRPRGEFFARPASFEVRRYATERFSAANLTPFSIFQLFNAFTSQ